MVVSVGIAAATRSYWAVAAATITAPVVMIAMSYVLAPHRPALSVREWRVFHGFLGWNTGAQLITVLNWQCDKLILGRLVSKAALGGFSLADSVSSLPAQALIAPLLRPVLAAFSHLNGDIARLREAYGRVSAAVLAIGLPPILAIAVLTEPIVRLLLGPKWLIAVPILKIIALGGILRLITSPLQPLAMALNRNKVFFIRSSWELAVKLPVMILAVWHYGVMGAVWVRMAMGVYNLVIEMALVKRLVDLRLVDQLAPLWRIALSGAAMAGAMAWTGRGLAEAQGPLALSAGLATAGLAGGAAYLLGLLVFWRLAGKPAGLEADVSGRVASLLQQAGRAA
jgi:PST family polysaccharide transporter